jgi:hypothetical protein
MNTDTVQTVEAVEAGMPLMDDGLIKRLAIG